MSMLSKDQILQARTAGIKKVTIKALGGDVLIRMMSMREQMQFADAMEGLGEDQIAALYASYLLSNEDGSRMYSTTDDIESLCEQLSSDALMEIGSVGNSMNGTKSDEVESAAKK